MPYHGIHDNFKTLDYTLAQLDLISYGRLASGFVK